MSVIFHHQFVYLFLFFSFLFFCRRHRYSFSLQVWTCLVLLSPHRCCVCVCVLAVVWGLFVDNRFLNTLHPIPSPHRLFLFFHSTEAHPHSGLVFSLVWCGGGGGIISSFSFRFGSRLSIDRFRLTGADVSLLFYSLSPVLVFDLNQSHPHKTAT